MATQLTPMGMRRDWLIWPECSNQGGLFYLSVPIGRERVEFNGHRIFDPLSLVRLAAENGLVLREFAWIRAGQTLVLSASPQRDMEELGKLPYVLAIFTFVKQ
jgi:hypothetical protein